MTLLLSAAQMREIERDAMESGRASGADLMERAGRGVVDALRLARPDLRPGRAVVLCGPGNNGGDGYVVARHLRARGWDVAVHAMAGLSALSGDARANAARWEGVVRPIDAPLDPRCDLIVDALFGTGLGRPVEGLSDLFARVNDARALTVALDLPSGICADSGRVLTSGRGQGPFAIRADLTFAFHAPKRGHVLASGPDHCGRVVVVDIGLDGTEDPSIARRTEGPDPARLRKRADAHKFDHGHLMVLAGGVGRGGAARMGARAALRIGAGLVTLGVPPAALIENAGHLDAIMLARIDDADALTARLEDDRLNALLLGPGLGLDDRAAALVRATLEAGRATLLDADALSLIARDPSLRARVHDRCVLTPHMGEFARLFPDQARGLDAPATSGPAFSAIDAALAAADGIGATILLKGAATVVADPSGKVRVNAATGGEAVPWLATAGAGDVLSGIVAGLLARGVAPPDAAATGAWLHAGAARAFGPGLIAEDLPDMLPRVLADLGV
ncbi:NAD(P)H-hydrate dehydratase [Palleronia sp. LCG004]|uniref:NAD(P)H-hydrate dehydratase n=1 Tax=Palleronia sp. LCG004 TaxID=3079304 RepID=UPI002943282E|nr:NAD(P)H-hydrate dehydratase [Palleronia sp. LCG004]WOI54874.1 NAD(P)H-hydrate dehydratase [Palleronia sp. LCG004]